MENIPNLLKEEVFKDFIKELKEEKYFITYRIQNAYDCGVPQNRNRLILLASKLGSIDFIGKSYEKINLKKAIGNLEAITAGIKNNPKDFIYVSSKLTEINMKRIKNLFLEELGIIGLKNYYQIVIKKHREKLINQYNEVIYFLKILEFYETKTMENDEKFLGFYNSSEGTFIDYLKILKSSCILILYNFIESTINDLTRYVYEEFNKENIPFEKNMYRN